MTLRKYGHRTFSQTCYSSLSNMISLFMGSIITPNHGPASGGAKLNIEGTGFMLGARVMVGERAGTTMVKDDMTIEAVAPPNAPGACSRACP